MHTLANNETSLNLSDTDMKVVAEFQKQLNPDSAQFSTRDGQNAPDALNAIIRSVIEAISQGRPISISTMPEKITTTTAASLLGVSRPTIMKYIRQGKLTSTMVGTHHRLNSAEVLELRESRKEELRQSVFSVMDLDN